MNVMKAIAKVSIAVACALGAGFAMAQSVERGGKVVSKPATQTVAQSSSAAPIQTAQASGAAAGGAAGGASTGSVVAGVGTAGTVGSTVVFVGTAAAAAATAANEGADQTVVH
jgi:hypothetical protein